MSRSVPPTCAAYREEMVLLGLKQRLSAEDLKPEEKARLEQEIRELASRLDLD